MIEALSRPYFLRLQSRALYLGQKMIHRIQRERERDKGEIGDSGNTATGCADRDK